MYAQDGFQVSDPRLEYKNNQLFIYFDILSAGKSDVFEVDVEIKNASGRFLHAVSLTGDIGAGIHGGKNRSICWNLAEDNIALSEEIEVLIHVRQILMDSPSSQESIGSASPEGEGYQRTGLVLRSVAFPGWGLSLATGKPHWIKGMAGYGCLAGTIVLNRMAASNYQGYLDAPTTEESNRLFQKSLQQDNASEILAYLTAAVWIGDLVWTILGTRNMQPNQSKIRTIEPLFYYTRTGPGNAIPVAGLLCRF